MRTNLPFVATLAGLAAALGMSIPLARGDARGATIPVSEIKEGMKGYGLTVFHGTQPERFDVEVIGVLHNFQPSQDLILIKTPNNARLDIAKGVHGMSGSPIYLDGRLAGAYSYLYSNFPAEPVAGVTPIAPDADGAPSTDPPRLLADSKGEDHSRRHRALSPSLRSARAGAEQRRTTESPAATTSTRTRRRSPIASGRERRAH